MAKLEIEHFDDELLLDLKRRASLHGCSVEEELNSVLRRALSKEIPDKSPKLTPKAFSIFLRFWIDKVPLIVSLSKSYQ